MEKTNKEFYDQFWPKNVPDFAETKKYMHHTIMEKSVQKALDAGCGHGICSLVLSELADSVTAVDVSSASLDVARGLAQTAERHNIIFSEQDLQFLDLPGNEFNLIWCWGVAMMAPDPMKVLDNLMRITAPGGSIYLGLYLKTWLSPIHQLVRHFCRRFMNTPRRKRFVMEFFTLSTKLIVAIRGYEINLRRDITSIQALVDDWYYPPFKTFYSKEEIIDLFQKNGFSAKVIQDQVGRMKSATIFVVRAKKSNN
jgi:ubiquinone/menaquinone biosynthesis C-methylase UbiE